MIEIEIPERTRARLLWWLVALTAAYSLANVLIFYTTGSYGPFWFTASILLYSALMAVAVALALLGPLETPQQATAAEPQSPEDRGEPTLLAKQEIYRTPTGHATEVIYQTPAGRRRTYLATTPGHVLSVDDIEDILDSVEITTDGIDARPEVDLILDRHAVKPDQPKTPELEVA